MNEKSLALRHAQYHLWGKRLENHTGFCCMCLKEKTGIFYQEGMGIEEACEECVLQPFESMDPYARFPNGHPEAGMPDWSKM